MKRGHPLLTAFALAVIGLLYLPLAGVAAFSVNASKRSLDWQGFTLDWYARLLHNEFILEAAWNTLLLAVLSTILATLLGTLLAVGLERFPWSRRADTSLDIILHIPVVLPDIIHAAALVVAFGLLRYVSSLFQPGLLNMVIGHVTFQVAFVALVVRSRPDQPGTGNRGSGARFVRFVIVSFSQNKPCRCFCRVSWPEPCWPSPCLLTISSSASLRRGRILLPCLFSSLPPSAGGSLRRFMPCPPWWSW